MNALAAATGFILLEACLCGSGDGHWSYHDQKWGATCERGQRQSPINIDTRGAVSVPAAPLRLRGYSDVQLVGENNGHVVQFSVTENSSKPVLSGGPLREDFSLVQLHFHWISEHTFDHVKFPVEIHLVHRRRDLPPGPTPLHPDGVAVLSVMCQISTSDGSGAALHQFQQPLTQLADTSSTLAAATYNIIGLVSDRDQSYYSYRGSLTTPNCEEVVTWIVLDTPRNITPSQFSALAKARGDAPNYRALQPLNSRIVFRPARARALGSATPPHRAAALPLLLLAAGALGPHT